MSYNCLAAGCRDRRKKNQFVIIPLRDVVKVLISCLCAVLEYVMGQLYWLYNLAFLISILQLGSVISE